VILGMDNVAEVSVYGEDNTITGNIVCAKVNLLKTEKINDFTKRLKMFCLNKMQNYKIPIKVFISNRPQYTERFKKYRLNV